MPTKEENKALIIRLIAFSPLLLALISIMVSMLTGSKIIGGIFFLLIILGAIIGGLYLIYIKYSKVQPKDPYDAKIITAKVVEVKK